MLAFNQSLDSYRPTNNIMHIPQVDLVKTLESFTVDDIIEKIQKICKQKNTRIAEFMRDYDKLRLGTITDTQFLSCLSMSKIFLSRKESSMLLEKYRNCEKEKHVNWRVFCDDIDVVFVVKELEKKSDIHDVTGITKNSFKLNELTLPEHAVLQDILKEMKSFFEINRIDPKPAFANYDPLKRGKVLRPQFKKIFQSMKLFLKDNDLEILMKKYGDPISNEINYIFILNDAKEVGKEVKYAEELLNEEAHKEFVPVLSSSNNFYTYQTHFLELEFNIKDVMDKIKHTVKSNRIRLYNFFTDFDTLRKGEVTKAKLRTALDMANLNLRKEEYEVLEKFFGVPGDNLRVNYRALVEEVDTVFTLKELEKDPNKRPEEFIMPEFLDPAKRLTSEENECLHKVMIKIATKANKYRVLPKAYFKDADRAKNCIIPSSKFSSIMNFMRLTVEEKEMNLLIKRFHGKNNIEINYFDFDAVMQKYCQELLDRTQL